MEWNVAKPKKKEKWKSTCDTVIFQNTELCELLNKNVNEKR